METYFLIKAHPYNFKAIVKQSTFDATDNDGQFVRITIGYKEKCVIIIVYTNDPLAHIEGVSYKDTCAMNELSMKGLDPGVGTVKMVKTALLFSLQLYPHVEGFTFKDASIIECNHNKHIKLTYFYLMKHGKTWYQAKFDAHPIRLQHAKLLSTTNLDNPIDISFEQFYADHISSYQRFMRMSKTEVFDALKQSYINSKTYREFLMKVDDERDCIVFQLWFDAYMADICAYQFSEALWVIDKSTVMTWDFPVRIQTTNVKPFVKNDNHLGVIIEGRSQLTLGGFFPYGMGNRRVRID
jgi:hypothetical protein